MSATIEDGLQGGIVKISDRLETACVTKRPPTLEEVAAVRLLESSEWQPIETVPKDGTEILLWYADMKAVNVAFWDGGQWRIRYAEGEHDLWEPTHWMHLPAPPEN